MQLPSQPREFSLWIDGQAAASSEGNWIERESPGHAVPVTRVPAGTAADVDRAVAAAKAAFDKVLGRGPLSSERASDPGGHRETNPSRQRRLGLLGNARKRQADLAGSGRSRVDSRIVGVRFRAEPSSLR